MTAEKYVKQIIKKVQCDKERRKDISRQLLSEIQERVSGGETLENIIKEMGGVKEVADSFNENISDAERKRYKRKKILKAVSVVIVILLLLSAVIKWYCPTVRDLDESQVFVKAEVEETLTEVIDLLDDGDYTALQAMATTSMASAINKEDMEKAKAMLAKDFGKRNSIGTIYASEVVQENAYFAVCQVNVGYENISVTYTITFDENMKIAGLYMK